MIGLDRARAWTALGGLALTTVLGAGPLEAATSLYGRVLGPGERPLDAVRVKIYVSGVAAAAVWADSTGAYAIDLPAAPDGATVIAWFVPVNDDLAAECVILSESPALSRPAVLPCVPRLLVGPEGAEYSPTLLEAGERLERLKRLPCFEKNFHEAR